MQIKDYPIDGFEIGENYKGKSIVVRCPGMANYIIGDGFCIPKEHVPKLIKELSHWITDAHVFSYMIPNDEGSYTIVFMSGHSVAMGMGPYLVAYLMCPEFNSLMVGFSRENALGLIAAMAKLLGED